MALKRSALWGVAFGGLVAFAHLSGAFEAQDDVRIMLHFQWVNPIGFM